MMRSIVSLLLATVVLTQESRADDRSLHETIDAHINARLQAEKLTAAEPVSDAGFLRRISLDLTGSIPDAETTRSFLADTDPSKRTKLVDQLLASEAFCNHMAVVFDVMLMERRPDKYVTTPEWRGYIAKSFGDNKPLNVFVAEILGADGVDEQHRPAAKFYLDRAVDKDVLVRDIGRMFLGVDLQCAQCHNHPDIEGYLHQHYHGLSVFVAGSKTFRQPDGTFVLQEMITREVEFASVFNPDDAEKTGPRLFDTVLEVPEFPEGEEYVEKPSRTVRAVPKFSLRELLAKNLPADDRPEFRRNMANRLWALLMGRGLVHPLHMHHAGNPPSHPELLDALSDHLVTTGYDTKAFLREVASSNAYQRSGLAPVDVDPNDIPVDSYALANMKGQSPEQLCESVLTATGAQAILELQIEEALAEEAAEAENAEDEPDPEKIAEARRLKRAEKVAEFVAVFGGVPGQPQPDFAAAAPQALFLANSELLAEWIPPRQGNLTERLAALTAADEIADELYLSVLSRLPVDEERQIVADQLATPDVDRNVVLMALVWSQLTSVEFRLNH